MAEVWDRKGSAPNVGQDRQAHYLFIPHHCRITARWVGRGVVARLYRHIHKPLMSIRYPIAFCGTAKPSVCSAWRLKVPKIEHLTHPKPYIVSKLGAFPKPFACFCALFAQADTLYCVETLYFSETFCLFLPYLFKPRPSLFVELGAFVHQRETSARFCHQRNLQAFFVTFCLFAFWRN